jgi:ribosomal 50S subunit-associated protein YjgA (DUF615 family)
MTTTLELTHGAVGVLAQLLTEEIEAIVESEGSKLPVVEDLVEIVRECARVGSEVAQEWLRRWYEPMGG